MKLGDTNLFHNKITADTGEFVRIMTLYLFVNGKFKWIA